MQHVAIDLGSRESQVCVRGPDGQILEERRHPTRRLAGFLFRQPRSRVVLEACTEAFAVADEALRAKHEVRVVPGMLVRSLGVGHRGIKTDERDARALSEVSCRIDLPSIHIPSVQSREIKSTCSMRENLIGCRTKLVNGVRAWARARIGTFRRGYPSGLPKRLRAKADDLGKTIPEYIERQLTAIEALNEQIRQADRELAELASSNEVAVRLMTVPGVGPVTALRFIASLDDFGRFGSASYVQSYLGLTPGEHSSGDRRRRTSITKAGSTKTRWTLIQAAWSFYRRAPNDPLAGWAKGIAERRGIQIAVTALARKLAGVLWAMWRDGTTYSPQH